MVGSYIDWRIFTVSFIVGLIGVTFVLDDERVVYDYPSLEHHTKFTKDDKCYAWVPRKAARCPLTPAYFPV